MQAMWAPRRVCGLVAHNVGRVAANVGSQSHGVAKNVGPRVTCLWAQAILIVGRYTYLAGPF